MIRARDTRGTSKWTDMARERLTRGLLLRLGVVLTAVCVSVHIYLETHRRGAPAALVSRRPTQSVQDLGKRSKQPSRGVEEHNGGVKRRISYVRSPRKDVPARRKDRDGEGPSPLCCPPPHSHRKVTSHLLPSPT